MKRINPVILKIITSSLLFFIALLFNDVFYLYLVLLLFSYVLVAYEVYINAFKNLKKGKIFDEQILMIIATIGAFCIGEYPEAVMVMLLFELGEFLSDLAIDKSKDSIVELMDLRSDTINLLREGKVATVDIKKAKVGDFFIVKPGETIPLDGVVVDGYSSADTSSLTGESKPKTIKPSYQVLSGTVNLTGVITVKATTEHTTSTAAKIIDLLENSNNKKTKTEKFITRFSRIYTPVIVAIAVLLTVVPTLFFKQDFNTWVYRSLELLVISCPCALVISVPLAFFCGIGRASKEGILIKGSNELDSLSKINAIILDKTGTITKGIFQVSNVYSINTISTSKLLEIAAAGEIYSNHPIAKSIIAKCGQRIDESKIEIHKEIPGYGIEYTYDRIVYYIGNSKLLSKHNIDAIETKNETGTIIYVANKDKCLGYIVISDLIKNEAYNLKEDLNLLGVNKLVMISGDDSNIVQQVAKEIGIDECFGNCLPIHKVEKIKELNKKYHTAFIGDGINDAPAIKIADIGISMGGIGSDAAIEASDMVLMRDDLNNITKAIKLSLKTKRTVLFNIVFALIFKFIIMILAIFGFSSMMLSVFADVGITLLLVLNSAGLIKKKI